MKYQDRIVIDQPVKQVAAAFDRREDWSYWRWPVEELSWRKGTPKAVDSEAFLRIRLYGVTIQMIEKIVQRDFPYLFVSEYYSQGVRLHVAHRFRQLPNGKTEVLVINDIRFPGLLQYVDFILSWRLRRQSKAYLWAFREYVRA